MEYITIDGGNTGGCTAGDADNDGVCDDVDICLAGDDNVDTDGDGTPDACDTCAVGDADNDGVCDDVDICLAGDDNIDTDGDGIPDACDTDEPGCTAGDADNDGVCDDVDVCLAGDDNVDTDGDGIPDACDTDEPTECTAAYTIDGSTVSLLLAGGEHYSVNIFNSAWAGEYTCFDDCAESVTLAEGTYYIHLKVLDASYQVVCETMEYITIDGGNTGGCTAGDADNDGVCDDVDICLAGDDNIDTDGDGTPDACDTDEPVGCDIAYSVGIGNLTITGLDAPNVIVAVYTSAWAPVFNCSNDCTNPLEINGLPTGEYIVHVKLFDASWQMTCELFESKIEVAGNTQFEINQNPILTLNALKSNREVSLNWVTNTDFQNDRYIVERSIDGENFSELENVESNTNSTSAIYYNTVDATPNMGVNYYRVKQIAQDGTYEYTEMRKVMFEIDLSELSVFPNPASESVYVNLNDFVGKQVKLEIHSALGQSMYKVELNEVNSTPVQIDLANFKNGVYSITIDVEGRNQVTKLFVVTKL